MLVIPVVTSPHQLQIEFLEGVVVEIGKTMAKSGPEQLPRPFGQHEGLIQPLLAGHGTQNLERSLMIRARFGVVWHLVILFLARRIIVQPGSGRYASEFVTNGFRGLAFDFSTKA